LAQAPAMGEDNAERTASVNYLRSAVGDVLAQAFAELAVAQPSDPVQFLSSWVNKYVEAQRVEAAVKAEQAELEVARTEYQAEQAEKRKIAEAKAAEQKAKVEGVTSFTEKLAGLLPEPAKEGIAGEPLPDFEPTYSDLIAKVEKLVPSRAIYLARVDGAETEGATPVLHFTKVGSAVSSFGTWIEGVEHKTQDFMLDVTFPYEGAGEVEDGPKPKVAIWKAFELPEAPEAEEGEEVPPPEYQPLHIKDVIDDEQLTAMAREVKFVGVTRLGELLVLPICSTNVLHAGAVDEAVAFMNDKEAKVKEAEEAYAAAKEEYDKIIEANANIPPESEEEPAEVPELPPTAEQVAEETKEIAVAGTGKSVQYALCLDTLGTEQQISAEEVSILMDAAKAAAAYRFRCDTYSVYQQATVQRAKALALAESGAEVDPAKEEFAAAKAKADEDAAAAAEAAKTAATPEAPAEGEEGEAPADTADMHVHELMLAEAQAKFDTYKAFFLTYKEQADASGLAIAPATAATAFAAGALMAGMDPLKVLHRGPGTPNWEAIRRILPEITGALEGVTMTGPRTGLKERAKMAFYKPMVETAAGGIEAAAEDPALLPLLQFLTAAVALREADITVRMGKEAPEPDDDFPPVVEAPPAEE